MKYAKASQMRRKRMGILYAAFLLVLSISILLMPIGSAQKEQSQIPMFISGACFWIGLIGTVWMAIKINKARKQSYLFKDKQPKVKQFGLICFFKNKEAKVADIAMFASAVGFIITRICTGSFYWLFIFLALFVFSFGMHCMLNGKNYFYLTYKAREEGKA